MSKMFAKKHEKVVHSTYFTKEVQKMYSPQVMCVIHACIHYSAHTCNRYNHFVHKILSGLRKGVSKL